MTDNKHDWDKTTWEGNRREQLRQSLKLSIRERIAAIEDMQEVSDALKRARIEGRLYCPNETDLNAASRPNPVKTRSRK